MSEVDRDELRRRLEEAPPLPWRYRERGYPGDGPSSVALEAKLFEVGWEAIAVGDYDKWSGDGVALAAAAVNALPGLLDALDVAEAAIERVREMHYAADNDSPRTPRCDECQGRAGAHPCGCWADEDRQPVCGHCNAQGLGQRVPWPCPTVEAIGGESDE